jgi:TatD DNase family protein
VTAALPPIDAHAHIAAGIHPDRLEVLRSALIAVTRSIDEWDQVRYRNDPLCIWGLGVHPGHRAASAAYRPEAFRARLTDAAFVGEVGLERYSPVRRDRQQEIFDDILAALLEQPRPVSVHSRGRTTEVVAALRRRPAPGVVLHWWTGDQKMTDAAVDLGCYFSINVAMSPAGVGALPQERVLTETDFPFVERPEDRPTAPGDVASAEQLLARVWDVDLFAVRRQVWRNFGSLYRATGTSMAVLPREIQVAVLTAS